MTSLATEFPVRPGITAAQFVAQVVAWLRGTEYSQVLNGKSMEDLGGDSALLQSESGEMLRLRQLIRGNKLEAIGFRHDNPDQYGRKWRTEAVLLCDGQQQPNLLRLRTECVALRPDSLVEVPRKPYLIKVLLSDGWGWQDGQFETSDQPRWLNEDENALAFALSVIEGSASRNLPVVYISATAANQWTLTLSEIEKLAYDLGGIAHVVVEPNRDFSFALRDLSVGRNVYAGAIGLFLPQRGYVNRLFIGPRTPDVPTLKASVRASAIYLRTQMPSEGWDWTELQERALRNQRENEQKRLGAEQIEKLYNEEIDLLRERINQLEAQLLDNLKETSDDSENWSLHSLLVEKFGPEIYPGEFSDRIRFAAKYCVEKADQTGLDERSRAVLQAVVRCVQGSPGLAALLEDLERASQDMGRLKATLLRHGYNEKSDNKHIRLEPNSKFIGLRSITLPKTPSDWRTNKNQQKDIESILGLKVLRGK